MKLHLLLPLLLLSSTCHSQAGQKEITSRIVGGPCEGCEVIDDHGPLPLNPVDTLPDFLQHSDYLKLTGTIYQPDGKTPTEGVILYIYHTDAGGEYQWKGTGKERYVHHRGWIQTGKDGRYTFYTFLPGAYPGRDEPRHIHPLIKEPDGKVYYIDEFVFDNDPLLTAQKRSRLQNRGSSGILQPEQKDGYLLAQRDIILGYNIPDY